MSSTLYLARLLEASPSGRVVVECVTIHPDAGMPPTIEQDGDGVYERQFVARLLEDALRDWLPGPSDGAPYQVVAFEAEIDPELVRGLRPQVFGSTAYW